MKTGLQETEDSFNEQYRTQFINGPYKAYQAYKKNQNIPETELNKLITENSSVTSGTDTATGSSSCNEEESKEHLEKLKSVSEIVVTSKKNSSIKFILRKKNKGTKKIYEIELDGGSSGRNAGTQTRNGNGEVADEKGVKPQGNKPGGIADEKGVKPQGNKPGGIADEKGNKPQGNKPGEVAISTATQNMEKLKQEIGTLMDNIGASDKEKVETQLTKVKEALALTESSKTALNGIPESEDAKQIISKIDELTTLATDTTTPANELIKELGESPDTTKIQAAKDKYSALITNQLRARLK